MSIVSLLNQIKNDEIVLPATHRYFVWDEKQILKCVQYEINQSWEKNNGLIGVYLNNIKDQNQKTDVKGADPFVKLKYTGIKTYDWVDDNGYANLGDWVEVAYQRAQNRKK